MSSYVKWSQSTEAAHSEAWVRIEHKGPCRQESPSHVTRPSYGDKFGVIYRPSDHRQRIWLSGTPDFPSAMCGCNMGRLWCVQLSLLSVVLQFACEPVEHAWFLHKHWPYQYFIKTVFPRGFYTQFSEVNSAGRFSGSLPELTCTPGPGSADS